METTFGKFETTFGSLRTTLRQRRHNFETTLRQILDNFLFGYCLESSQKGARLTKRGAGGSKTTGALNGRNCDITLTLCALVAGIEKVVFERKKAVIKVLGIILKMEMVLLTKEKSNVLKSVFKNT